MAIFLQSIQEIKIGRIGVNLLILKKISPNFLWTVLENLLLSTFQFFLSAKKKQQTDSLQKLHELEGWNYYACTYIDMFRIEP